MRKFWRVSLSALHACLLLVLTLVWMNLSWEFGDEVIVARVNEIVRYHILQESDALTDSLRKDLLFVNCSYDKALAEFEDEHGSGTRQITDRQKLARILKIINEAKVQPKMVVVDLLFDDPTPHDSLLYSELKRTHNLVLSGVLENDGSYRPRWPDLNYSLAQYSTTTDAFLKYNLLEDTLTYLPSTMLRISTGTELKPWGGLARSYPGWWMNSFIVDLPVRQSHLDAAEVLVWHLGQSLELYSQEEMEEVIAGKIIILGDIYAYDIHDTLLGNMPGPVIVANAYLGLLKGTPKIAFLDIFLVFLLYFSTTLYIVFWRPHREKLLRLPRYRSKVGKFVFKYFTYIVTFSLYSVLLYILLGKHFQLLLFGLYFNLFEFLVDWYRERREVRSKK